MFWLHWIGKSYYHTPKNFLTEARKFGITRRIGLKTLKRMKWGDRVVCIMREPGLKSGSLFMEFPVTLISGLSAEVQGEVMAKFDYEIVDLGGMMVSRGCGSYVTGPSATVNASIEEMAEVIEEADDPGLPMIGCRPHEIKIFTEPWVIMPAVPHRMGFRTFDGGTFLKLLGSVENGKRLSIPGQLYFDEEVDEQGEDTGQVETVINYAKN